jgi:hypothetical protein
MWSYCWDVKKSSLNAGTLSRGFTVYGRCNFGIILGNMSKFKYFKKWH